MNNDQVGGVIRAIVPGIAAALSHYALNDATWTIVLTSLATAAVAVWSYRTNKPGTVIPVSPK